MDIGEGQEGGAQTPTEEVCMSAHLPPSSEVIFSSDVDGTIMRQPVAHHIHPKGFVPCKSLAIDGENITTVSEAHRGRDSVGLAELQCYWWSSNRGGIARLGLAGPWGKDG